MFSDNV